MKRKVIQLAGQTLVVSLPSRWARQNNIRKGQEIEVKEKTDSLVIRGNSEKEILQTSLDAKGMSERVYRWYMSSLHKQGFDEIRISYDNPECVAWTQDLIRNLFLGFIITSQTSTQMHISKVSEEIVSQFDTSLRRSFLVTINMGETMISMLKSKDYAALTSLIGLEKSNNQLTNFCERLLNRKPKEEKTCFYYVVAWNNEKICDDLKYMCQVLAKSKRSVSGDFLKFLEKAISFYKDFYKVFYTFDVKILESIKKERKSFLAQLEDYLKNKKPDEAILFLHAASFIMKIDDFSASTIAIRHEAVKG